MAKIMCVFYEDPISGYTKTYSCNFFPKHECYLDGMALPTPIDFKSGQLLGCVSGELGLRMFLKCCLENRSIRNEYLIVDKENLVDMGGAYSSTASNATGGSEEALKFKKS